MADLRLIEMCSSAGCAAKIGPGELSRIIKDLPRFKTPDLIVGFDTSDDACVYRLDETRYLIQTVDFFPPMVDDPYVFGQIAAANALSDVYAMGGRPFLAMNLLCFPTCLSKDSVRAILEGGHEKAAEAGVVIAGGHTIDDLTPKYGLCVSGFAGKDDLLENRGAKEGDALVLTKPLGTGVLTTALKAGMLDDENYKTLIESMTRLNGFGLDALKGLGANAMTDITGFALMGHAREMADSSMVTLEISVADLPFFPGALDAARMGLIPSGAYGNRNFLKDFVSVGSGISLEVSDILFDPQTSGGLLIALPEKNADTLLRRLEDHTPFARRIGTVRARGEKSVTAV